MAHQLSLAATCFTLAMTLSALVVAHPSVAAPAPESETAGQALVASTEGTTFDAAMTRDSHVTFAFWPNWRNDNRTFAGRIVHFGRPEAALPRTTIKLVRYERIGSEPDDPMKVSLQELQEGEGRNFFVEELMMVEADQDGNFEFADLGGGMYSVQPDWSQIEGGVDLVMLTGKVPEVVSLGEPRVVSLSAGYPGDRSP